ncbi:UNVERIFIED_CONTAM: hypothetical protein NCL1_17962 [Trichonephila clavipes]
MVNLGHQSFPPTALGRQEYEEATPGVRSSQYVSNILINNTQFTCLTISNVHMGSHNMRVVLFEIDSNNSYSVVLSFKLYASIEVRYRNTFVII